MLQPGTVGEATVIVSESNTAQTMKSGALPVFATPSMVALMEEAACVALAPQLGDGEESVGVAISVSHDAASKLGATIVAKATVTAVEGRKVSFTVEAFDGNVCIGKGDHHRFIISAERFMAKLG